MLWVSECIQGLLFHIMCVRVCVQSRGYMGYCAAVYGFGGYAGVLCCIEGGLGVYKGILLQFGILWCIQVHGDVVSVSRAVYRVLCCSGGSGVYRGIRL